MTFLKIKNILRTKNIKILVLKVTKKAKQIYRCRHQRAGGHVSRLTTTPVRCASFRSLSFRLCCAIVACAARRFNIFPPPVSAS